MSTVELIHVLDASIDRDVLDVILGCVQAPQEDRTGTAISLGANHLGAAFTEGITQEIGQRNKGVIAAYTVLNAVDVQKDKVSHSATLPNNRPLVVAEAQRQRTYLLDMITRECPYLSAEPGKLEFAGLEIFIGG
ncbi:MAG TPA: hypothetical protein PKZ32_12070 [Candidatus Melainabacteria bacterium]|nr:hypothetical protein [Candidatus Melainabacteria bacterium]